MKTLPERLRAFAANALIDEAADAIDELVEALEAWEGLYDNAHIKTGICCCGGDMKNHAYTSDHSPTDQGEYYASQIAEFTRAILTKYKAGET